MANYVSFRIMSDDDFVPSEELLDSGKLSYSHEDDCYYYHCYYYHCYYAEDINEMLRGMVFKTVEIKPDIDEDEPINLWLLN